MKIFGFTFVSAAVSKSSSWPNPKVAGLSGYDRFQSDSVASTLGQYLGSYLFPMPGVNFMTLFGDMDQVFNYGCWCQLVTPDGVREGIGAPMDAIDQACKDWHSCMDCLIIDHECSIFPVAYEAGKDGNGDVTCNNQANDMCAESACKCDDRLVQRISEQWFNKNAEFNINDSADSFDHESRCVAAAPQPKPGNGNNQCENGVADAAKKQCCGTYPDRYPYSTSEGCRQCCGAKTFNVDKHQCCDNTLAAFGSC